MLEVCSQLFNQWNESNVSYCHWKSNEHLQEGLDGYTDLDVYVLPTDKVKAEKILVNCNYKACIIQKGHRYPNVVEWIGFDTETGRLVHVHLHYQLITGTKYCKEYVFPLDKLIISTRIKDLGTDVYVTNPDLEIILLFCRIALKAKNHNEIKPGIDDIKEIKYLQNRISNNNVLALCKGIMKDDGECFHTLILKDSLNYTEWKRVYHISSNWLAPYRKYSKLVVFLRHTYYRVREYFILGSNKYIHTNMINQKIFNKKGFAVCFLGQDGSGKSTVTIELCRWLNWKIEAKRFYLGSGDHYNGVLKRLFSLGNNLKTNKSKNKSEEKNLSIKKETKTPIYTKKRKKDLKTFISSFLVCLYNLNLAYRAWRVIKSANRYIKKGGIAIYDRFPQMQFENISDGPRIAKYYHDNGLDFWPNKKMAKLELVFFKSIQKYQPQLVFKLMLPPEESIRRKPFENLENVRQKHEVTKRLAFPYSSQFIVDATQEYQQELIYIKTIIWKKIGGFLE